MYLSSFEVCMLLGIHSIPFTPFRLFTFDFPWRFELSGVDCITDSSSFAKWRKERIKYNKKGKEFHPFVNIKYTRSFSYQSDLLNSFFKNFINCTNTKIPFLFIISSLVHTSDWMLFFSRIKKIVIRKLLCTRKIKSILFKKKHSDLFYCYLHVLHS